MKTLIAIIIAGMLGVATPGNPWSWSAPGPLEDGWIIEDAPVPDDGWVVEDAPDPFEDGWVIEDAPDPFEDGWVTEDAPVPEE